MLLGPIHLEPLGGDVHATSVLRAIAGPAGPVDVTLRDSTQIWIDRHERGLATRNGSLEDCREGATAEVKYADPDTRQEAEWVKLRDPVPR